MDSLGALHVARSLRELWFFEVVWCVNAVLTLDDLDLFSAYSPTLSFELGKGGQAEGISDAMPYVDRSPATS